MSRLKPCPFCGKKIARVVDAQYGYYFVSCWGGCHCRTGYCITAEEAKKKWRTRK